jgi:hypothetical protein
MNRIIWINFLITAVLAFFVGIYISVFEDFIADKAYLFFAIALVFGIVSYRKRNMR